MSAVVDYPHITKPPGGSAHLERLPRIRVAMIVDDYLGRGWSAEEIVLHYPHLALAEIHAALAYYHDHEEEIDRERSNDFQNSSAAAQSQSSPLARRLKALKQSVWAWMSVALYMDVHVPAPIWRQLRVRGVDLLTAQEDGTTTLSDDALLIRAGSLGRVMVTHDIRFKAMAEDLIRKHQIFGGMIYGHAEGASIGQYVRDLELIATACSPGEFQSQVLHLPL